MHKEKKYLEFNTMSYSHIIRIIQSVPHKHKLFHPFLSPSETIHCMSTIDDKRFKSPLEMVDSFIDHSMFSQT